MEDMKKQQLEVLAEAKTYCEKLLKSIDTVIPELRGERKDDTDEYLRMTVDSINNALEMYNATRTVISDMVDEQKANDAVKVLANALGKGEDAAKADALEGIRPFIEEFLNAAKANN